MPAQGFHDIADRLTKALVAGDFALYRSLMILPMKVTPRGGQAYVMDSDAALRADFDLYHQIILLHGVTDIFRDVLEVVPDGPDRAVVHLVTHILQRANRIVDPFEQRFHLLRQGGQWYIAEIESTEGHINWTLGRRGVSPQGQFTQKEDGDAKA